jgi:hypothetical protein
LRRRFFSATGALIPLLLLSKSNPLTLGFDLVFAAQIRKNRE